MCIQDVLCGMNKGCSLEVRRRDGHTQEQRWDQDRKPGFDFLASNPRSLIAPEESKSEQMWRSPYVGQRSVLPRLSEDGKVIGTGCLSLGAPYGRCLAAGQAAGTRFRLPRLTSVLQQRLPCSFSYMFQLARVKHVPTVGKAWGSSFSTETNKQNH